jgi:hypothetical protein
VDRELLSRDLPKKPRASEPSARDGVLRRIITTYSYLDISIFRFMNQNLPPIFRSSLVTRTDNNCRTLPTPATEYYGQPIIITADHYLTVCHSLTHALTLRRTGK